MVIVVYENVTPKLRALRRVMKSDRLGEVYSRGAHDPRRGVFNYEFYVQHHQRQATIHKGRWPTDEEIARKRDSFVAEQLNELVEEVYESGRTGVAGRFVELILDTLQRDFQDYPPELPNQRYVRTHTLHDSWTTRANL